MSLWDHLVFYDGSSDMACYLERKVHRDYFFEGETIGPCSVNSIPNFTPLLFYRMNVLSEVISADESCITYFLRIIHSLKPVFSL